MSALRFQDPVSHEWVEITGLAPQKGVDYFTPAEIRAIMDEIIEELKNDDEFKQEIAELVRNM